MRLRKNAMLVVKRMIDILLASVGLIVLLPVFIALAVAIRLRMGSPVLFSQLRPGKNGVPFKIYKFRTMHDYRDENGDLLPDEKRVTQLGVFLRSTSLDELPELFDVVKGDMSLVGPRPLLMQYLERYTPEQARRHEVRPGITGWAQVNGRNAITWEEKFALDLWYIDNWSIWLDFKIILRTIWLALRREGINAPGSATMPEFWGTGTLESEDRSVQEAAAGSDITL